jgi:hypothetical protein
MLRISSDATRQIILKPEHSRADGIPQENHWRALVLSESKPQAMDEVSTITAGI